MDISIIDSYDNEAYAYDARIVTSTRREIPLVVPTTDSTSTHSARALGVC